MPKYVIWEIRYGAHEYCLLCMSSKDFKQAFVEIEKEGSLKNAEHQFSVRFYFITFPNVNWFLVTISHFNGLKKSFQMLYRKLKSIQNWSRNRAKHFRTLLILGLIEPKRWTQGERKDCHFMHHAANVCKAAMTKYVIGEIHVSKKYWAHAYYVLSPRLTFIVLEKFKLPVSGNPDFVDFSSCGTSLWKDVLTKGLIPERYV